MEGMWGRGVAPNAPLEQSVQLQLVPDNMRDHHWLTQATEKQNALLVIIDVYRTTNPGITIVIINGNPMAH